MGFRLKARYEEFECPASIMPYDDDGEPFRATVRTNLTFEEIDTLPKGQGMTFGEVFDALHPYVVAWNWTATDRKTGEDVPVPPPAEVGRDAFSILPQEAVVWLLAKVRLGHLGGEKRKKPSTLPGTTGEPDSVESRETAATHSQNPRSA